MSIVLVGDTSSGKTVFLSSLLKCYYDEKSPYALRIDEPRSLQEMLDGALRRLNAARRLAVPPQEPHTELPDEVQRQIRADFERQLENIADFMSDADKLWRERRFPKPTMELGYFRWQLVERHPQRTSRLSSWLRGPRPPEVVDLPIRDTPGEFLEQVPPSFVDEVRRAQGLIYLLDPESDNNDRTFRKMARLLTSVSRPGAHGMEQQRVAVCISKSDLLDAGCAAPTAARQLAGDAIALLEGYYRPDASGDPRVRYHLISSLSPKCDADGFPRSGCFVGPLGESRPLGALASPAELRKMREMIDWLLGGRR